MNLENLEKVSMQWFTNVISKKNGKNLRKKNLKYNYQAPRALKFHPTRVNLMRMT